MNPNAWELPEGWSRPGAYLLLLLLRQGVVLRVGRLGEFPLPRGYYAYVGSARGPGGVRARVARHLRRDKSLRWHIDYLAQYGDILDVWASFGRARRECDWAAVLVRSAGARRLVPGFGASDCGCAGHLLYWQRRPPDHLIETLLGAERVPCP